MVYGLERGAHARIDQRITIISVVILLFFLAVVWRLFWLQVLAHEQYATAALIQHFRQAEVSATRGQIFARDHTNSQSEDLYPLVANKILYEVYINPTEITRPQNTAEALASALGLDVADILPRVEKEGDIYEPIKKRVTDQELALVKKIDLPGIYSREEYWRFYPDKEVGSHILGYYGASDKGNQGFYGLEGYWDDVLSGSNAEQTVAESGSGAIITGASELSQAIDGADLLLTLDRTIQYEACRALDRSAVELGANGGSVIIMETQTGRILAMCNTPGFDPNQYQQVETISNFNNNAVFEAYEPGSVLKAITMAVAIDDRKVEPTTSYEDSGTVKLAGFEIKNSDRKAHGVQTMTQVLENSLNTGMIFATQNVTNETFRDYISNFGFGKKFDLDLDQESAGDISSLSKHGLIHKATASFGQGLTVTPLQMLAASNVLASGGKLYKPYIVEEIRYADGRVDKRQPEVIRNVIRPETAAKVTSMMVSVVENGFGKRAGVPGYYVAGKTGTAQVAEGGSYGGKTIQTFIGFAPANKPKFTMLTKLNNPSGAGWAESSAAPLFGELAEFLLHYYQIPPER